MSRFQGILKRKRYYDRRFTSKQELVQMIEHCIHGVISGAAEPGRAPLTEKRKLCLAAA